MRAQKQVEEECQQCLQEKKRRAKEQKKEEDLQKQKEEETCKNTAIAEAAAMALGVSPGKSGQQDIFDPAINNHLVSIMQGGMEVETTEEGKRDGTQSPLKNKQMTTYVEITAAAPPAAKVKNVSTSFDSHVHKHQRVIVEAFIKLMGANPTQEFTVDLQELLKNGQLVDKSFAFSPVKSDVGDKKIQKTLGVPTNMTMLGAHFKISSNGKNPFEKQKA
jgi:hypothetical protein